MFVYHGLGNVWGYNAAWVWYNHQRTKLARALDTDVWAVLLCLRNRVTTRSLHLLVSNWVEIQASEAKSRTYIKGAKSYLLVILFKSKLPPHT